MVTETTVVILHMAVVKKSNSVNHLGLTCHRGQLVYHHRKRIDRPSFSSLYSHRKSKSSWLYPLAPCEVSVPTKPALGHCVIFKCISECSIKGGAQHTGYSLCIL